MAEKMGCPNCREILDDSAMVSGRPAIAPASTGAILICCYCNSMLIYQADGTLRNVTGDEWELVATEMKRYGLVSLIPPKPPHLVS